MLDYDLVIIGDTPTAIYAALAATTFRARVALVQPTLSTDATLTSGLNGIHGLSQVGYWLQQLHRAPQFGIYCESADLDVHFDETIRWINGVVANLKERNTSAVLTSLGIDVIVDTGHFVNKPHLAFVVQGRHLRGFTYLLAPAAQSQIPDIEGLSNLEYFTPETLGQGLAKMIMGETTDFHRSPQRWVIIGGNPAGLELAQALVRLEQSVTLIVEKSYLLSKEEPEASFLIQSCLEAEGVRILTNTTVSQAKIIQGQKWIQAGNEAIEADQIFLATRQIPQLESLNLDAVGVQMKGDKLQLNAKLQTTNPRIYVCGDVAGGYALPHIANYQAQIALKNALFLPIHSVNYHNIPWAVFSDPQLTRIGLTEQQARRRYGNKVKIYQQHFKTLDQAVIKGETIGFCKLIGDQKGKILGATLIGTQATELMPTIALAMSQNISLQTLAQQSLISPSFSEIIGQTAAGFQQKNPWENWLENLFHWRRYWFS